MEIMRRQGVAVEEVRAIDHEIATGVWPDMTEHGWPQDDWPAIYEKVEAAHILVVCSPIWLGEKSSVCTKVIERLYGNSHLLNDRGQYAYYGRVGGCLITGNEDGVKHCAMNILYSLQHLGYVVPPQADAGWIGEAGPGPSYLDPGSGGPGERLHQPQHDVHDVEPAAPRPHGHRRGRDPGPRQPAVGVGRRLPLRLPEPGAPMSTLEWHRVADIGDLADGRVRPVTVDRHTICLTRCGDEYGALDNRCPHQGGPLGEGSIENGLLRCPWHGYDYDPLTGQPPPGFTRRPGGAPGRGARRRRVGGAAQGDGPRAHRR